MLGLACEGKLCQLWVSDGRELPWVVVLCGSAPSSPTSVPGK